MLIKLIVLGVVVAGVGAWLLFKRNKATDASIEEGICDAGIEDMASQFNKELENEGFFNNMKDKLQNKD